MGHAYFKALGVCAAGFYLTTALSSAAVAQTLNPPTAAEVTPPNPLDERGTTDRVDVAGADSGPCPLEGQSAVIDLGRLTFLQPDGSPLNPEIAAAIESVRPTDGQVSIATLCGIRDAANRALRQAGWVASVQIPPQEIIDGAVRLNVVSARIVEVRLAGDPGPYEELILQRVDMLKAMDPLNEREAERLLLLAGDIPGLDIRLSLRPAGTSPGEVIGNLTVNFSRSAIIFNAQNYYARNLGREVAYIRGEYYGLTGMGDVTYIGLSSTFDLEEQIIGQIGHTMTLNSSGATLSGRFTYAESRPDITGADFRTETWIAGIDFSQPLVRSLDTNFTLNAGVDYVDQISRIFNGGTGLPISKDKLRIVYLGADAQFQGFGDDGLPDWRLNTEVELRKGFGIFGASPDAAERARAAANGNVITPTSRFDGQSDAFVFRALVESEVFLGPVVSLYGSLEGQWTDDPLLNYEEFSLGNLTAGRGYDPGSNSADRAFAGTAEFRAQLPVSWSVRPQLFAFYDYVFLDNLDPGSTEVDRNLASYGGGVRLVLPGRALLEVTYASPQDRALLLDSAPPPDRVLVSLSVRFGG